MGRRKARNSYWWLWLSPLLTVPTAVLSWWLIGQAGVAPAILISALWHLVLLIPALDREHPFVRWHGWQALLLATVRTAVPLGFGLAHGEDNRVFGFIPFQIAVWLGGTLWGQLQAARGKCSLMHWLGQGELLASLQRADPATRVAAMDPDTLVEIIRCSRDPKQRQAALRELEAKYMVEQL